MKSYRQLPDHYQQIMQINMQSDKKTALKINAGGSAVMLAVLAAGHFIVPIWEFFDMTSPGLYFLRLLILIISYLAYMVLHELTHAAVMKAAGGGKVVFGFTGLYAFAGSREDYFDKSSYRCIALAPLIVWGIVFGVLAFLVPESWFWVIWFLQAGNIGGAAGDVYVTGKLWNLPDTIRVKDTGVDMMVFDADQH